MSLLRIKRLLESCRSILLPLCLTWLACFIYMLMDWFFFITKPSILSYFTLAEKASSLFTGTLLVFLGFLPAVLLLSLLYIIVKKYLHKEIHTLNYLVPAFILAATAYLLVDNFTYTLFAVNTANFAGLFRYVYALAFVVFMLYAGFKLHALVKNCSVSSLFLVTLTVLIPALAYTLASYSAAETYGVETTAQENRQMPNIFILSSDGIDASHMSVYGYERETTPFLRSMQNETMIFENHFSNAANTTGSVISLLTGKLPTSTRVVYPPDTLGGSDSYQHLPGLLRKMGYTNADISIRYYADTEELNLLEGFDYINDRDTRTWGLSARVFSLIGNAFPSESLFLKRTFNRISERLFHIAGMRTMENPFTEVTDTKEHKHPADIMRLQMAFDFIESASSPFFIQMHLMGTHGPKFYSRKPVFSAGQEQTTNYMQGFYDDAIRDFDSYIEEVVTFLKDKGVYDDTLLIINTDHGQQFYAGVPLPLLFKFPNSQLVGKKTVPSQRIDIAPTILGMLNVKTPEWMEGQSLLGLDDVARRYIFSTASAPNEASERGYFSVIDSGPPFYSMGIISLVQCQIIFSVNLRQNRVLRNSISNYRDECPEDELLSNSQAANAIKAHLQSKGYDVSKLKIE